jgi:hypothetical protein
MDDNNPRNQSLVRRLVHKFIYVCHANADVTFYTAIAVALTAWGLAYILGHLGNKVIPFDFKTIRLTDYHQAYDIYKNDSILILQRTREGQQGSLIAFFSFISVFVIANCISVFRLKPAPAPPFDRYSRFGAILAISMWVALMYLYVYPSIVVITQPQTLVLDPTHNLVILNDEVVGTLTGIIEFENTESKGPKVESSRFGFTLKDGSYRELTSGVWVGGNLPLITAYLNQYLQTQQHEMHSGN